jgi:hypothetical protein
MLVAGVMAGAREVESATLNVPGDYPSIQSAIDAAASGDTVLVAAGTYLERVDFLGKSLEVVSVSGPQATFIDAAGSGSVVTFQRGEPRAAVLSGFTITNGNSFDGAGIRIWNSSPTLHGNVIMGNRGCTGVGVYSYFSSPRIEHNTISGNVVQGCSGAWGVGVYIGGNSDAELVSNEIVDNAGADASGGGVALFAAGRPLLLLNTIARNSTTINGTCGWGGGVAIANYVEAKIVNNLIAQNKACTGRAIYWINPSSSGVTTVVNNTIVDNAGGSEPSIYMSGVGSANRFINNVVSGTGGPLIVCQATSWATAPAFDSNDVFSSVGTLYAGSCADQTGVASNISIDPGFRNPLVGDYSIDFSSPLVDAGNNAAPYLPSADLTGGPRIASAAGAPDRIDIGAYEFYNQGPTADAGPDQTVTANSSCVATVTLSGSGVDPEGDPLTFTWSGPFGEVTGGTASVTLGAGVHLVTLTVTDGRGGTTTDTVTVSVLDSTPPVIASLSASPSVLTKANHEMVSVTVAPTATDGCGATVTCRIVSVSSNEPVTGTGGGDLSPDWEITGNLTVRLRAERAAKGNGRVYTITVRCTDAAGNASTSTVSVAVPRK